MARRRRVSYQPTEGISYALRSQIINDYAPLVSFIATKLMARLPPSVDIGDLTSAGFIGLMDAIEKFDPSRANTFRTYSEWRIRGSMLDELRLMDQVPRSVRERAKRLERTVRDVEQAKGRRADLAEVADAMGVGIEEMHMLKSRVVTSAVGDPTTPAAATPDDLLQVSLTQREVRDLLDQMPETMRLVIAMYHFENLSMKDIGAVLDISESRVSQIRSEAIKWFRRKLSV